MRDWRRFFFNRLNLSSCAIVVFFVFVAVAAPLLAPADDPSHPTPFKLVESRERDPLRPGRDAPLGTATYFDFPDVLFHFDILHSLIWGTRAALRFGLVVALSTACIGVLIGVTSGYLGGWINGLVMRIADALLAFPLIAGIWLFRQIMATANARVMIPGFQIVTAPPTPLQRLVLTLRLDPIMVALILFSWMPYTRIVSANIILLKQTEYVQAARSLGASAPRIVLRHLLPNAIAPAIVLVARDVGGMVVLRAAFTFIGLGGSVISPLDSSGGGEISEWSRLLLLGRHWIIGQGGNPLSYWWVYLPATLALLLFGVGWNVLGDRLNTLLNPREVH